MSCFEWQVSAVNVSILHETFIRQSVHRCQGYLGVLLYNQMSAGNVTV